MTERRPLVLIGDTPTVLPPGDTLPGAGGGAASDINNVTYQWDFLNNTANADIWSGGGSLGGNNTGAVGSFADSNHPGVVRLSSVATVNSGYRYTSGAGTSGALIIPLGARFFCIASTPATEAASSTIGFHNSVSASDPSTGAYFSLSGASVTARCANGGSLSSDAMTNLVADAWYTFEIVSGSGEYVFTIYTESGDIHDTATITTNLPASATGTGVVAWSTVATAMPVLYVDLLRLELTNLGRF